VRADRISRIHARVWHLLRRLRRPIVAVIAFVLALLSPSFHGPLSSAELAVIVSALAAFIGYGWLLPVSLRYDILRWILDVVCVSLIVCVTGGVESPLYLMYIFPLVFSGRWYGWPCSVSVTLAVLVCYPLSCAIAGPDAFTMRGGILIISRLVFLVPVAAVAADTWTKERRRKALLVETITPLVAETGEPGLYLHIEEAARKVTAADVATLFLVTPDKKHLEPQKPSGTRDVGAMSTIPIERGVVGKCVRDRATIVLRNIPKERHAYGYIDHLVGAKSEACAPIVVGGDVAGVLCVESVLLDHFGQDEVDLLESLAVLAAIAIERLRGSEYRTVLDASKSILATHRREGSLKIVVEAASKLTGVDSVDIRLLDESGKYLRFVHGWCRPGFENGPPDEKDPLDPDDSICAWVVVNKKPFICDDAEHQEHPRAKPGFENRGSYICVPLQIGDRVFGAIGLASSKKKSFGETHLRHLLLLGELAALGIDAEAHLRIEQTLAGVGTGVSLVRRPLDWEERVKRRCTDDDWDKGLDLRIDGVNTQQREWFRAQGEPVGSICYKFYNSKAQDRPCANCPVCEAFVDGKLHTAWAPALAKAKGRCVHYLLFARPYGGSGSQEKAVETVVDITDLCETRYLAGELIGKVNRRDIYGVGVEAMGRILQADWGVVVDRESVSDPFTIGDCFECRPDNEKEIALARRGTANEEELIRDYLQRRPRQFFTSPPLLAMNPVLDAEAVAELEAWVTPRDGGRGCIDLRPGERWPRWIGIGDGPSEARRGLMVPFFGAGGEFLGAVFLLDRADLGPYSLSEKTNCYTGGRLIGAAIQNTMVHRLERINKERGIYVVGLAHFLRSHAHSVMGKLEYMELLLDDLTGGADAGKRSQLKAVSQGMADGLRLMVRKTSDMLLLASEAFAGGRGAVLSGPHDLASMVGGVIETYRSMAQSRSIDLRFQSGDAIFQSWYDPATLELALSNLVENGIKYGTPGTPVDISLSYHQDGDLVRLSITGWGQRVCDGVRARMFDKFYRGDPSGGMDGTGIGLGLWVTSEVIRQHGGDISFSSEPALVPPPHDESERRFINEFRVTLPRIPAPAKKEGSSHGSVRV